MKKTHYLVLGLIACFLVSLGLIQPRLNKIMIDDDETVYSLLQKLGDTPANHEVNESISGVSAKSGENLIKNGFSLNTYGKRKGTKQSKFFVCTSCHNLQREDPDLTVSDPEQRLEYVVENDLPLLQATTLWGAVNRETFYNGDYLKKYGDLVKAARNDMRKAIQLCATECAQGRPLADWEVESILAYLWTLEMDLEDLGLNAEKQANLDSRLDDPAGYPNLISDIKKQYLTGSPATFHDAPENRKAGFAYEGRPEKGQLVYDHSCKHCHENARYSFFELDDSKASFRFLKNHFVKYTRYSTYHVTAYGAPSRPGKRAYMPHYPLEKLSLQQIEDLRAFFESKL